MTDLNKIINEQRERIAELEKYNYELNQTIHNTQWPEKCPITRRNFFMEIDGKPTYGGPFDSYTIPLMDGEDNEQFHNRELYCSRYDHDEGCWVDDETIQLRVIHENVIYELQERAEAAERERDMLKEYSYEQALLPSASFNGVRELVNDIHKDATDVGGCYEVSTGLLDSLFEAFTDAGACKLLNKFAIEQQIKVLEDLIENSGRRDFYNNRYSQGYISTDAAKDRVNQLRQQLNGGERWGQ